MAKKQEQVNEIVENEAIVINEKDIVSGEELKENDLIDVKAPEVIVEEEAKAKVKGVKLRVLVAFTDKYTKVDYAINDEIIVDEARAKELLADPRGLVEKLD